jgi:hemerythrin-like domain-containing protein
VGQLAEAVEARHRGDAGAGESILKSLRGLIDLYPGHTWKEDYLLFPMTNKILGAEDQTALRERFAAVEAGIGPDVHRRLERLAEAIERGAQAH